MTDFARAEATAGAKTLASPYYCDPALFAREQERIFARSWVYASRIEELEANGAFRTIELAGESLIIARGADGVLRAFFNVCRHRGTRICSESTGRFTGSIQCPYHAWTYGLDGKLIAARNMDDTPGFDRTDYPLHAARVTEWLGCIFVNLSADAPDFTESLAGLDDRFARWNLAALRIADSRTYEVAANWKLIFQNYSECYHCPVVHPQLEQLSPWNSGRNDLLEGPVLGGFSTLRDEVALPNLIGDAERRAYYYTIFPSLLLSLHGDYAMLHTVEPLDVHRTRITCTWLFAEDDMARVDFDANAVVAFWDLTNRQDWDVSELTQLGVASRAYTPGPYARSEGLLDAFDRHYLSTMEPHA